MIMVDRGSWAGPAVPRGPVGLARRGPWGRWASGVAHV